MNKFIETANGNAPLLLEMPHSGPIGIGMHTRRDVPRILADNLRDSDAVDRTIRFGMDHAVPYLTGYQTLMADTKLGLNGLRNHLARALTDVNRSKDEISGEVLESKPRDEHNSGVLLGRTVPMGLDFSDPKNMRAAAQAQFEPMFERPFTEQEFAAVMRIVYDDYHATLRHIHDGLRTRYGACLHLSLHTLPAAHVDKIDGNYVLGGSAKKGPLDLATGKLPDIILIHNNFQAAARKYINTVRRAFEEAGLLVSDGAGPFVGSNGVTALYGNPEQGHHVIGIEHVSHDIEVDRHAGGLKLDLSSIDRMQKAYRKVVENLLIQLK